MQSNLGTCPLNDMFARYPQPDNRIAIVPNERPPPKLSQVGRTEQGCEAHVTVNRPGARPRLRGRRTMHMHGATRPTNRMGTEEVPLAAAR